MTTEHNPDEAGLSFAVRMNKGNFTGRAALARAKPASRRLVTLVFGCQGGVVMGGEPVFADGHAAGYVTSAAYGYTAGRPLAYAWLPSDVAVPGTPVTVEYFGDRHPAAVAADPVVDPEMRRIRR